MSENHTENLSKLKHTNMEETKLSPKMSNMFCVKFTNAEGALIAGSEYLSKQLKTISYDPPEFSLQPFSFGFGSFTFEDDIWNHAAKAVMSVSSRDGGTDIVIEISAGDFPMVTERVVLIDCQIMKVEHTTPFTVCSSEDAEPLQKQAMFRFRDVRWEFVE